MMMLKIYGEIYECEELKNIVEEIRTTPGDVELVLNSPGGDAIAAFDVCNAIQSCGHNVTAKVETLAASAAAVIALACDKVQIDKNSLIMLHHCWTMAAGNKEELQGEIDAMTAIDKIIDNIIMEHCKNPEQLQEALKGDVWLTGEEVAEMFDNVELIEIQRPEGVKAALGGLGTYIAAMRRDNANMAERINALTTKEPEYTIDDDLRVLLETKL